MPRLFHQSAFLECRRTPWDEHVFGFPCAEIVSLDASDPVALAQLLKQFDAWARAEGVRFAYGRFASTGINKQALHEADFYFAEASYRIYHSKLQASESFDRLIRPGPVLVPARETDLPVLQQILADDFHHGRIHEDPWVSPEQAAQRNRNWLHDLMVQGHEILSYCLKDEVIGLHIQRSRGTTTDLVLTGVKRSHALLGVSLWADALKMNRLRGVREAHTLISAANIPIMNLYRRFEFQFESLLLGFHKRYPS